MLQNLVEKKLNIKIDDLIQLFHKNNYCELKVTKLLKESPENLQLLSIKAKL